MMENKNHSTILSGSLANLARQIRNMDESLSFILYGLGQTTKGVEMLQSQLKAISTSLDESACNIYEQFEQNKKLEEENNG